MPVVLPHVPGYDVSGTVDAVGEDVGADGPRPGDAVIGFLPMERDGGAAEYVTALAEAWVAAPSTVPLADARRCRQWRSPPGRRCSTTATWAMVSAC